MRPFASTIPFAEALALALTAVRPIERTEVLRLDDADGRVLAEAVTADADVPAFDRAAMDGYAVRHQDVDVPGNGDRPSLRCVERIYTGSWPECRLGPGECAEIATGAPVPPGADAVVMVEDTEPGPATHTVRILGQVRAGQNISRRGADLREGEVVLTTGDHLVPSRLGACAAAGRAHVTVFARPVVTIVSTGTELRAPGDPLRPGQVYDINRFTLSAIVSAHGGIARTVPSAADDLPALREVLRSALEVSDMTVFSGGSSVGERDLVMDVIRESAHVLFHGIAVKPGKPTAVATAGSRLVLAMPGNPASCLSNGYLFLLPMLRRLARLPGHRPQTVVRPLSQRIVSTAARHQFYTVRIEEDLVVPAFKASGDITSMSRADGYVEVPAGVEGVEAGELVEVKLF